MDESRGLSRRSVLRASAATVGLGGIGTASAVDGSLLDQDESFDDPEQVPPVDVTESADQLETVPADVVVPEQSSSIGPGSMLFITREDGTKTTGCTANFVWEGSGSMYLGTAGHCLLPRDASADDNAGGEYDSSEVTVRVCVDCSFGGATALSTGLVRGRLVKLGPVAYARQRQDDTALGNDFGLVEIPSDAEDLVDASMPMWGGPTGTGAINTAESVVMYGNGIGVGETFATKGRAGTGVTNNSNQGTWVAELPASPGDSGSGVQVARQTGSGPQGEQAAGILTHLVVGGTAGTNIAKAREMATEAGLDVNVKTV